MLKIFLDTEFTGLRQDTSLISLALAADTGEEFYAEFTDFNRKQADNWIMENVISNLMTDDECRSFDLKKMRIKDNKHGIRAALEIWLDQFGKKKDERGKVIPSIQIWADVPHYDWVLFCELFGGAQHIPKQIHYMPMDLATLLQIKTGSSDTQRDLLTEKEKLPEGKQHNALYDAKLGLKILNKYLQNEKENII